MMFTDVQKHALLAVMLLAGLATTTPRRADAASADKHTDARSTHALTVEDLLAVRSVTRLDISPDGQRTLIVTQGINLAENVPTQEVWLANTQAGNVLQPLPSVAAQSQWRADSQALTFLKPAAGCTQLWSVPVTTREPVVRSSACLKPQERTFTTFHESADGRFVAFLAQAPANDALEASMKQFTAMPASPTAPQKCVEAGSDEAKALGMDALDRACSGTSVGTGWMWGLEVASPALRFFSPIEKPLPPTELWIIEPVTGAMRRVSDPALDVRQFAWSTKGHDLAWMTLAPRDTKDELAPYMAGSGSSMSFGGEAVIQWSDAADANNTSHRIGSGELRAIDLLRLDLAWSPDGHAIVATTPEVVRVFDRVATATSPGWDHEVFKGRVMQVDWAADSRSLYVLRYEHQTQELLKVDAKSARVEPATRDARWHGHMSFSADHRAFVVTLEDVTEPTRVYLGASGASALHEIVGFSALNPHWLSVKPMVRGRIDWRSYDDKYDFYGVTINAAKPAPTTPRPTVVILLGAGMPTNLQFGMDSQQPVLPLAAAGYQVFVPNSRGRGGGITPKGYQGLGDERTYFSKPWRDVMQGVDALIAKGLADANRLGVMGVSYGGGLSAYGIAHTTRFKAAVLKEPVALSMAESWRGIWGHKSFGGDVIGKQYGIDNPYVGEGKTFIEEESALTHVDAVRTPTLMEFGVKSGSVQTGGEEFYQGLVWFGVPAELVMYPRTLHGFMEPKLAADAFERELAWFKKYLSREPTG